MVTKFEAVTRLTVRGLIARRPGVDDAIAEGTATAGANNTLTDAGQLSFVEADMLVGAWIFIHTGLGSGQERYITASSIVGVVTVSVDWATNPDNTSQYEIHRKYRISDYNEIIDAALRSDRLNHRNIFVWENLLAQGLVKNPLFQDWADGASSAPDDWTLSGTGATVARVTSIRRRGPYGCSLKNGGDNSLTFKQTLEGIGDGQTLKAKAVIHAGAATPAVTVKIDDGISTASSSTAHAGAGLEVVSVEHTVAITAVGPAVAVSVEIASSATQLSAIVDSFHVRSPDLIHDYILHSRFQYVYSVKASRETASDGLQTRYPEYVDVDWWEPTAGAESPTSRLTLPRNINEDRAIQVKGLAYPEMPTGDTTELEVNVEILILKAAFLLTRNDSFERDFQTLAAQTRISIPSNAKRVGIA